MSTMHAAGIRGWRAGIATMLLLIVMLAWPAAEVRAEQSDGATGPITWGIAPSSPSAADGRGALEHLLDPGQRVTEHVVVRHLGTQELQLDLYAADAAVSDGVFDLLSDDEASAGVGRWTSLTEDQLTLAPGERRVVELEIDVPADAEPGDHAGGVVAVLRAPSGEEQVQLERRVGTRIYLRITGTVRPELDVDITEAEFTNPRLPFTPGSGEATVTVTNTGNIRLSGTATLRAEGPLGLGAIALEPVSVRELLPGESLEIGMPLTGVAPLGKLKLTAAVKPVASGTQELTGLAPDLAHAGLWAIPSSTLAVLALLSMGIGWLLGRRAQVPNRGKGSSEKTTSNGTSK